MWTLHSLLSLAWAGLLAFGVLAYVLLDGFDLGTGILFLAERNCYDRDLMMNSLAPVWDGNETWLVFGGAGLYAMFPPAYAVILPALYPLVIAMLLGLILRGVSFEFRFRATGAGQALWDIAFCGGSLVAAFAQGLVLGGLLQGIHVRNGVYAGGWWDWLTPFTVLCGIAVVIGYTLLGSCWLIWRTEGALQARSRVHAGRLAIATLGLIVVVSLVTPLLHPQYSARWFSWPGILLTSPVPVLVGLVGLLLRHGLRHQHQWTPLLAAQLWFVLCFAGLGISLYPLIVPPAITIYQAAAPVISQAFLIVGAVVIIPIILAYNAYAYWIFRGKVQPGMHYH
ncbi:MAG TPA: cytochrome d ubiquinol oxidase subunit II [Acetobacteraceae bacterium]|nr:cytochrome d ubiquinol oxidase subunit II [Acetobacteraceae bacterium]